MGDIVRFLELVVSLGGLLWKVAPAARPVCAHCDATKVEATCKGEVREVRGLPLGGAFPFLVRVVDDNGGAHAFHLNAPLVRQGQRVKRGDVLGTRW